MSFSAGTRLGPYEILSLLGVGGMGEVYRARDTKLGRDVAIKVLPDAVSADRDRLARFEREAQVLAALNHPHIAHIHGVDDSTGIRALVMELVEGPTLAERLARGPIPLDEALPIAKQIAEALEAAHEQGIIHRDLKPANIKIKPDDTVKVLDFGLAKAMQSAGGAEPRASQSPTITTPAMTQAGMLLGTAAYMAPEQAKGKAADRRSDMWAFGCVLYEMLTGTRAFLGEDVGDTLANVLKTEPDWTILPAGTPPSVRRLLRRCLAKDRRQRLSDAAMARLEIDEAPIDTAVRDQGPPSAGRRLERIAWPIAIIVTAVVAIFLISRWSIRPAVPMPLVRFRVTLPEGSNVLNAAAPTFAVSPDGASIAVGTTHGLMLHSFAEDQARTILSTTILPSTPTFSPDGRWVAFFSPAGLGVDTLKKVAVAGGLAVTLAEQVVPPLGASWSGSRIVFGTRLKGVIGVSENGGAPETIVEPTHGEVIQSPQLLPAGEAMLFTVAPPLRQPTTITAGVPIADWDHADIVVQSLKTGQRKTLISAGTDGRYVPSGHLLFARGGVLFAVRFDVRRLEVVGGPVPVLGGVRRTSTVGSAFYTFSDNGSLVYASGPATGNVTGTTLVWTTATGAVERLDVPAGSYETPRIAPDGRQAAVTYTDASGTNVWMVDLFGRQAMRRLTFGGQNKYPVWSPTGDRVAFQTDRDGDFGIFAQRADGTGTAERLTRTPRGVAPVPESWAPDGKHLLFSTTEGNTMTLSTLSLGDGTTEPFGNVRSTEPTNAVFSPDGRWVAYGSTESGTPAVYVQPFPATGVKYQVSRDDIGHHALWSRDGRRLFYIPQPGRLAFVNVTTQPSFGVSVPMPVPRAFSVGNAQTDPRNHDIAGDGRLLGIVPVGEESGTTSPPQIDVVLNWFEELQARVPAK